MRLTVLEFAERYRIREADASKLLRRAALDERLEEKPCAYRTTQL